jgi:hypothetical protein
MMLNNTFLAMWDNTGLEFLTCLTDYHKDFMWSTLKGEKPKLNYPPLSMMILRAKANHHRHYEIYMFQSDDVSAEDIKQQFEINPQGIVDLIRKCGNMIYSDRADNSVVIV